MKEKIKSFLAIFLTIFFVNMFARTIGKIASLSNSIFSQIFIVVVLVLLTLKFIYKLNIYIVMWIVGADLIRSALIFCSAGLWIMAFQIINFIAYFLEIDGDILIFLSNFIFGFAYWFKHRKLKSLIKEYKKAHDNLTSMLGE